MQVAPVASPFASPGLIPADSLNDDPGHFCVASPGANPGANHAINASASPAALAAACAPASPAAMYIAHRLARARAIPCAGPIAVPVAPPLANPSVPWNTALGQQNMGHLQLGSAHEMRKREPNPQHCHGPEVRNVVPSIQPANEGFLLGQDDDGNGGHVVLCGAWYRCTHGWSGCIGCIT